MKFIRDLFNRQGAELVKLSDLAEMISPVHIPAMLNPSQQNIAKGFSELTDWTRIGFHFESSKSRTSEAMNSALRSLTHQIESATPIKAKDGSPAIYLRRDDLRVLRATCWQIPEAATNLRFMGENMKAAPEIRDTTDKHGNPRRVMDFTGVIPIYNRPNGDHSLAADQIEDCLGRMEAYFGAKGPRPANDATVRRYADIQKLYR